MLPQASHTALSLQEVPSRERLAAFESLRGEVCPWLLDSALPSERLGRFSFAGADPYLVLRVRGEKLEAWCRRAVVPGLVPGRRILSGDFFEVVRALLPRVPARAAETTLPFVGGAVVALGYELAARIEDVQPAPLDDLGLPEATLLFVDRVLAWDHLEERLFAAGLGFGTHERQARAHADEAARACRGWLEARPAPAPPRTLRPPRPPCAFFDASAYAKAVDAVKQEIEAGNVYQANLSHRVECDFRGDPWRLYRVLRTLNPAPFACYLELPEVTVVGSSPERFLRVTGDGAVESRPIKGTRPRGNDAAADARFRAALAASQKDRAENLMIVDLVRNDLGRACATGSIEVPELFRVENYASVFHLVSSVTGRLRGGHDALDLVRAAFPPGSMTGAPKIAAMRLLSRLEPVRRGIYSGAIGFLDARGGADLSVVIRTLFLRRSRAMLHVGGGIVADSDPRDEWLETLDKARPLLEALRLAGAGSIQARLG